MLLRARILIYAISISPSKYIPSVKSDGEVSPIINVIICGKGFRIYIRVLLPLIVCCTHHPTKNINYY